MAPSNFNASALGSLNGTPIGSPIRLTSCTLKFHRRSHTLVIDDRIRKLPTTLFNEGPKRSTACGWHGLFSSLRKCHFVMEHNFSRNGLASCTHSAMFAVRASPRGVLSFTCHCFHRPAPTYTNFQLFTDRLKLHKSYIKATYPSPFPNK